MLHLLQSQWLLLGGSCDFLVNPSLSLPLSLGKKGCFFPYATYTPPSKKQSAHNLRLKKVLVEKNQDLRKNKVHATYLFFFAFDLRFPRLDLTPFQEVPFN